MTKFIYPAIFYKEGSEYWVEFPDLEGCQSFGSTFEETHENAKEALNVYIMTLLEQGRNVPHPSDVYSIKTLQNAFVSLVDANLTRKSQSVKKTLTMPTWLNEKAEKVHVKV